MCFAHEAMILHLVLKSRGSRWLTNLASKGDTGFASFCIMLEELFSSGRLRKGERILGFIPESGRFSVGYF